jgi:antitoxin VapB
MKTATAKVFKSGNSQALRLPKAFRFASETVTLIKTSSGFLARDDRAHGKKLKKFASLAGACPDFPIIPANTAPNIKRAWE